MVLLVVHGDVIPTRRSLMVNAERGLVLEGGPWLFFDQLYLGAVNLYSWFLFVCLFVCLTVVVSSLAHLLESHSCTVEKNSL
jgi:hypothetical protein